MVFGIGRHLPHRGFGRWSLGDRAGLQWRHFEQFTHALHGVSPLHVAPLAAPASMMDARTIQSVFMARFYTSANASNRIKSSSLSTQPAEALVPGRTAEAPIPAMVMEPVADDVAGCW